MLRKLAGIAAVAAGMMGVAAPSAQACGDSFSQVFSPWNDSGYYAPILNGDFEYGLLGWTVTGSASLVEDSPRKLPEHYNETSVLELRPGSSATTPPICVSSGYPTARMFAHTTVPSLDSGSTLQVEVLYTDATRGGQAVKKLGSAPTELVWNPARKMSLAQGQLNIKPDSSGHTWVRYRFTPLYKTTWRIDDVYIDPRLRG